MLIKPPALSSSFFNTQYNIDLDQEKVLAGL